MPNMSVTDFYTRLWKHKPLDDFEGLGQSKEITEARMRAASEWLYYHNEVWVDLGAGTGNLIKYSAQGKCPKCYVAVDMFYECQRQIEILCRDRNQPFLYIHKPEDMLFEDMLESAKLRHASIAAINVMGNGYYDTIPKLKHAVRTFMRYSWRGFVTVPLMYEGYMREPHLTRHQEAAIRHAFKDCRPALTIETVFGREAWLRW